jgi:hypothetical protein
MTLDRFFLYCAIAGGALFLVQLAISALGGLGHGDVDVDLDVGGGAHAHGSPDTAFKLLSLQGLSAFFGMFGLVGLAMYDESRMGVLPSLVGAFLGGSLTTWVIARIFRAAAKLEGSGTLKLDRAVGAHGTVYLRIAPNKPGKLTISIDGRLVQLDAVSTVETHETGSEVRVEAVLPDGSVRVTKP